MGLCVGSVCLYRAVLSIVPKSKAVVTPNIIEHPTPAVGDRGGPGCLSESCAVFCCGSVVVGGDQVMNTPGTFCWNLVVCQEILGFSEVAGILVVAE